MNSFNRLVLAGAVIASGIPVAFAQVATPQNADACAGLTGSAKSICEQRKENDYASVCAPLVDQYTPYRKCLARKAAKRTRVLPDIRPTFGQDQMAGQARPNLLPLVIKLCTNANNVLEPQCVHDRMREYRKGYFNIGFIRSGRLTREITSDILFCRRYRNMEVRMACEEVGGSKYIEMMNDPK